MLDFLDCEDFDKGEQFGFRALVSEEILIDLLIAFRGVDKVGGEVEDGF